jgi:hypothetical protein
MTERERLTEMIKGGLMEHIGKSCNLAENLADYLLANGVIVPPVRVGQKVWYIKGGYYNSVRKHPREIEVTEINHKWSGKTLAWGFIANQTRYRFSSIGKTVFLTKEEAEKALERSRG